LKLGGGKYGLLFSGGGCIDGDSDAFRYIGYAESSDPLSWNVVNGLENPLLIASPYTINVDQNGAPVASGGTPVSVPSTPAVAGVTSGFFAGRVYAPSATLADGDDSERDQHADRQHPVVADDEVVPEGEKAADAIHQDVVATGRRWYCRNTWTAAAAPRPYWPNTASTAANTG